MKKSLTLTVSITVKMIVYAPVTREEANQRAREKKQQGKFAEKVKVWLAVCSYDVASPRLFEKGTLHHRYRYIKEVLPVTLRYPNSKFGSN